MNCKKYLNDLTSKYAPSGDEGSFGMYLVTLLSDYGKSYMDDMNNVFCEIEGKGSHVMIDAHLDHIGFVVVAVDDDGFLKLAPCGGIDRRSLLSHRVTVWGSEKLNGVISCQPPHLITSESYVQAPKISDIAVDIGMGKIEAEKIVNLGDRVTLNYINNELQNDCISSSFLDDRSGIAAIICALDILKEMDVNRKITVVFSSQEEVGTRGSVPASFRINPDEAIAVDVSFAYTPDSKVNQCGKAGQGVMIGISPTLSKEVYEKMKKVAADNDIEYQLEVMGGSTGTNADVISISGIGVKTGLLSIPIKYMHTPIESLCIKDVESTAKLLAMYISDKGGEHNV